MQMARDYGIQLSFDDELLAAYSITLDHNFENPEEAIAYYMRGLAELNLNEVDTARADIERFLELAPEHSQAAAARDVLSYLPPPTEGAEQ